MMRVAIGPSSFAKADALPQKMLEEAGVEVIQNPYGRRLSEEEILTQLVDVDGLIAGLEPLNRTVLMKSPKLQAIARVGIGMENVDLVAAQELGIKVSNTPEGPTNAVAEMALGVLLSIGRQILPANQALHEGKWEKQIGFGIAGLNILLIGYGRIGRRFAEHLRHFSANIFVVDPYVEPSSLKNGETLVTLPEGLALADVVSIHVPGNDQLISDTEFGFMKPGVVILNSARGPAVNEQALIAALENGTVAGGWLDVFWDEPYTGPLTEFPQMVLTPHMGTYSRQCRLAMETQAVENLLSDLGVQ